MLYIALKLLRSQHIGHHHRHHQDTVNQRTISNPFYTHRRNSEHTLDKDDCQYNIEYVSPDGYIHRLLGKAQTFGKLLKCTEYHQR
ncbi:hypothetical protein D3C81_1487570 [compost metagenome]